MIQYNPKAAQAIGYLKSPLNDVEIFVEDTGTSALWLSLIKNCLPKGMKIASVTPLGGRNAVEKACAADQSSSGRRRLYIIDADFDYILNTPKPRLKHLHRIPAYCIEGLVFEKKRIVALSSVLRPDIAEEANDNFEEFFDKQWAPYLRELAARYSLSMLAGGVELTCKFHVGRLGISRDGYYISDPDSIYSRCATIMLDLRTRTVVPTEALKSIINNAASLPLNKTISGKTYLIVLAQRWIHSYTGLDLPIQSLFNLLVSNGKCPDGQLKRRLASA